MKVLAIMSPSSFFFNSGKIRYANFIQEQIDKKEYTDIFQLVYDDTCLRNNSMLAMRWVKIAQEKQDSWMQDFWCDESFFFTTESFSFSFQEIFVERLKFIGATEVHVCGDNKNDFQKGLKDILKNENIKITVKNIAL